MGPAPVVIGISGSMRRSSQVTMARKSSESNMMWLQGAKVLSPGNAEDWDIGVEDVAWHANGTLPNAPTVVNSETE